MTKRSLLTASLLLIAAGDLAVGQEPTNQLLRETRYHERVLSPVLEVREFSGEFERWGRDMTVNAPKAEVFRWSTPASGTASARWSVLDGPPGSDAAVVGSGSAGSAPRAGSVTVFRIDFRKFFPSGPPAEGTTYWVVLEPVDAAGQAGPQSMPVQLTYAAQLDPAAFAGREGDVVAPSQIALSKTSKLTFLRDFLEQFPDLPAKVTEGAEAAVATGDLPDAHVRLTPREPVIFTIMPGLGLKPHMLHMLSFDQPWQAEPWVGHRPDGWVKFREGTGRVFMTLSLEPDQFYLLQMSVGMGDPEATLFLRTYGCLIDFEGSAEAFATKEFSVSPGDNHLLAMVGKPASLPSEEICSFFLTSGAVEWRFFSAELSKLTED